MTLPRSREEGDVEADLVRALDDRSSLAVLLRAADERILGLRRELAAFRGEPAKALPELVVRALRAAEPLHELDLSALAAAVGSTKAHIAVTVARTRGKPFLIDGQSWRIAPINPLRGVVKLEPVTGERIRVEAQRRKRAQERRVKLERDRRKANVERRERLREAERKRAAEKAQKRKRQQAKKKMPARKKRGGGKQARSE